MAIRRLDPNSRKKVVSVMDEAVDIEASNMNQYATTLDLKHIKFVEGKHPTYFIVKSIDPISETEIQEVHHKFIPPSVTKEGEKIGAKVTIERHKEMALKYFKFCVMEVEENGKVLPIKFDEFSADVLQEIGSYAMLYCRLGDQLKKT